VRQLRYLALAAGEPAGALRVDLTGTEVTVSLRVENNGCGAKHVDRYVFDDRDFLIRRSLVGNSMVGAPVSEEFSIRGGTARWRSPADAGECPATPDSVYLSCENNAYSVARYVRLGMAAGGELAG
jgi:hypothetical protein